MDTRVAADGMLIRRYVLALTPAGQALRLRLQQHALVCVGYTVLLRRARAAAPVPAPRPATDTLTTDPLTTGEMPR